MRIRNTAVLAHEKRHIFYSQYSWVISFALNRLIAQTDTILKTRQTAKYMLTLQMTSYWRKPFLFLASEFAELSVPVSDRNILSIQYIYDAILPSTTINSLLSDIFTLYIERKPTWYLLFIYPQPDVILHFVER
jgi:hypothetical protein